MDAMMLYRVGNAVHRRGWRRTAKMIDRFNYLITRCSIPSTCTIGEGTVVGYGGLVLVVHSNAIVGKRCVLGQAVTIGAREAFVGAVSNPVPRIGDDVYIAAGAKVLGDIEIGSNSIIGANAVVLQSFPPHSVIAGIPARAVGKTEAGYTAIRHDVHGA
jgi:serine O-acetyltransferase